MTKRIVLFWILLLVKDFQKIIISICRFSDRLSDFPIYSTSLKVIGIFHPMPMAVSQFEQICLLFLQELELLSSLTWSLPGAHGEIQSTSSFHIVHYRAKRGCKSTIKRAR